MMKAFSPSSLRLLRYNLLTPSARPPSNHAILRSFSSSRFIGLRLPHHVHPSQSGRRLWQSRLTPATKQLRSARYNSSSPKPNPKPNPTPDLGSPAPAPSLSQRLRKLSREYGWSALGVYLALTALDFPFCFLAVQYLGTERVGRWEHAVIEAFWKVVRIPFPDLGKKDAILEGNGADGKAQEEVYGWSSEVVDADERNSGSKATLWTQLALAYAIHKSFIFVRVPLTAAVTPKVVKTLRKWGFDIGKRRPKSPTKPPTDA